MGSAHPCPGAHAISLMCYRTARASAHRLQLAFGKADSCSALQSVDNEFPNAASALSH